MKTNNVLELITGRDLVIPRVLLKYYKDMKLDIKEMLFLAYLMSYSNNIPFDVNTFSNDLNYSSDEVMVIMAHLCEINLISMNVKKDSIMKEYLDISFLYNKLLLYVMQDDKEEAKDSKDSDVYSEIEKEFGRMLSPIEYETIKGWLDGNISEELIREALKEAVLNGVNNLKYIDKILFEWNKKGYKKKADIKKKKEEVIDIFDYDWLKDNE